MWECNHTGSKWNVDEWHVAEASNEGSLEEESEVGVVVDHSLLRDGEVSSLANEEIRPLYTDNGDEISSLSIEESLKRVANEVSGHMGVDEELWNIVTWSPSALRPISFWSVEEEDTKIDSILEVGNPVKGYSFI